MKITELNLENSKVKGRVLTADSEGYDSARATWDLSVSQRPKVIVEVANASDVVAAVHFAHDNGLKISVKNTGHGVSLPADDNMLIVVSSMRAVYIDRDQQTAKVEAGAKWLDVLVKAQEVGLAPLMGSSSDVGAIGYTMGGGMGWLARKYGLSVDNVLSFEVVTADGQMHHVSKSDNAELFWGLCGGGAALGIVTAMEVKLFPVKSVYAGSLFYPRELAPEVFSRYREWLDSITDDWTTSISIVNFPPLPFIPEFLQGQSVVIVRGCYVGEIEEATETIQEWLDWKEPIANLFGTLPFLEADRISDDPTEPSPIMVTNVILSDLSDEVINTLIQRAFKEDETNPLFMAELHHAGGAMAKADRDAVAFSQHDAPFVLRLLGITPTPEATQAFTEVENLIKQELAAYSRSGVFLNFIAGAQKYNHTERAFTPDTYQRLINLKKRYDPYNTFSFSLNLPTDR